MGKIKFISIALISIPIAWVLYYFCKGFVEGYKERCKNKE